MLLEMEGVLTALEEFGRKPSDAIPTVLEEYLIRVSKTGETLFPWTKCKILIQRKLDAAMKSFNAEMPYDGIATVPNAEVVRFDDMRRNILAAIDNFTGAPFTIQRLCELVTNPKRHYTRTDKFLRGLEKNVLVVTTVDPMGRKITSDKLSARALVVNGMSPSRHSSSSGCALWKSPAVSDNAVASVCHAQGDIVKDDAGVSSPALDSSTSNGSSSSSSSISSFDSEHAECEDARGAAGGGVGSSTAAAAAAADTGVGGLIACQATDSSASVAAAAGVKRPSADSLLSAKCVPAKQACQIAQLPGADADGAAACGGGGESMLPLPVASSEPVNCAAAAAAQDACASDVASFAPAASPGDASAAIGTSDARLGASDPMDSVRPDSTAIAVAAAKEVCLAEHDGGSANGSGNCIPCKPSAPSSTKGDGDSAELATSTVQVATEIDSSGCIPVDGGDSRSGSPSKLCCPPAQPGTTSPIAAAVSEST